MGEKNVVLESELTDRDIGKDGEAATRVTKPCDQSRCVGRRLSTFLGYRSMQACVT